MNPNAPSPMWRQAAARGNCVRIPALLQTLLALLATILGRRAHAIPTFTDLALADLTSACSTPLHQIDPERSYTAYDALVQAILEAQSAAPHGGCRARILYVLGPRPNRGMRTHPRLFPHAPNPTARPPPRTTKKPSPLGGEGWVRGEAAP